jgi:anaerobic ribonucleoside-triphosphate reductase activating protein
MQNAKVKINDEVLHIHTIMPHSSANGPGLRAVIWLQGCPFHCAGCFNENMWSPDAGRDVLSKILFKWLCSIKGITGITLSGGEPTEQIPALLPFLKDVRNKTNLSTLIFSGRTLEQILELQGGDTLISLTDVLIDGHYDLEKANPLSVWPPSSNQRIHFLTNRYSETNFSGLPFYEAFINPSGEVVESGILKSSNL